ncbi:MAG: ATP-binding cassette domain-containing protein [Candidatus Izimaplasma sp.]|nr:ATP-binding cassette domain-containing protein [Candidatus Izimaplasma bacterium]
MSNNTKLEVKDLTISFKTTQGMVRAVRGVDFELQQGETLAIVGESGSGKSVTSRTIMGILAGNGVIDKGNIFYEGEDLTQIEESEFHEIRGNKIGMIFQDPMSSLNPIMRIGKQITEGMILNGKRLKQQFEKLFHEEEARVHWLKRDIKRAKREFKKLKEKAKDDSSINLAEAKQTMQARVQKAKEELKPAKKELKRAKSEAKIKIKEIWNEQKEKANKDIQVLKDQLQGADDAKAADIKQKIIDRKEELARFKQVTKREARERAIKVMDEVGIPEPEKRLRQYPFQFSGGMRQRIVIAIALTLDPELLICDEPTTALDVTIQAQILELINKLKREHNLSVIFITHDLGVVANMADRIAVMYAGRIVELGTSEDVFYDPRHPYTWALLGSMPDLDSKERLVAIPGTPPNMLFPPKGDAFADRNKYAMKIDFERQPPMFKISDTHSAATWLLHKDAPKVEPPEVIKHRIERMLKRNSSSEVKS